MAIIDETISKVIFNYIDDVKKVFEIDKTYVYGSHAKGTATKYSDIDICFFSNNFNDKKSVDIIFELLKLARKYSDFDIEPRGYSTDEINNGNPFIKEILQSGYEIIV